jgi:hypothetical protein
MGMKIYDLSRKRGGSLCVLLQVLVVPLPKQSHKVATSRGFIRESALSTNTVDNFVDSFVPEPLNPFRIKDFPALIKKVAAKNINKNKALKKTARAIDSRAIFLFTAPILCISRKNAC